MSNKVDERITRIRFDNDQFERGVATSMQSLDRLKNKLESTESVEAFSGVTKAAEKTDLSGITKAIEGVSEKFSYLRMIAINVLSDIASQAISTGVAMVKNLSTDNIAAGWSKYDQELQAVQTIMVTLDDTPLEEVEKSLKKIGWFSDETSYSYEEMVGSMSKLISSGVSLEDATNAVIGLSNAAAAAGVSTKKAQQAFYNFSQAFGAGYMQLQDWRSIELLNMATPEFKRNIIQTAVSLGKLVQVGEDLYATSDNLNKPDSWFSTNAMRGSLKDKWFDNEVMNKVLGTYSEFANQVYEMQQAWDIDTASETMDQLEDMGIAVDNVSNKAFRAAQEAKTFAEAIDSVKDAVSTKWKDTFKMLFGNYENAKGLWTDLANELYDLFAASGDVRNEILAQWNDPLSFMVPDEKVRAAYQFPELQAGRDILVEGLWNIYYSIVNVVNLIKDAWREVFPQITAKKLYDLTKRFRDFTAKIRTSTENLDGFRSFLVDVFSLLRTGLSGIKTFLGYLKQLWPVAKKVGSILKVIGSQIVQFFKDASSYLKIGEKLGDRAGKLQKIIEGFKKTILNFDENSIHLPTFQDFLEAIDKVKAATAGFRQKISDIFSWIREKFQQFMPVKTIDGISWSVLNLENVTSDLANNIKPSLDKVKTFFVNTWTVISGVFRSIGSGVQSIAQWITNAFGGVKLKDILGTTILGILTWFEFKLALTIGRIGKVIDAVSDVIWAFSKVLQSKAFEIRIKAMRNFALAILAIAGALFIISRIDHQKIDQAGITVILIALTLTTIAVVLAKLEAKLKATNGLGVTFKKGEGLKLSGNMSRTGIIGLVVGVLGMVLAIRLMYNMITENKMSMEKIHELSKYVGAMVIAIGAAAGLMQALTGVGGLLSRGNKYKSSSFAPVALATSMLIMIRVFEKLDQMKIEHAGQVIFGIIGILGSLFVLSLFVGRISAGAGLGILSIVAAVYLAVIGIQRLQNINIDLSEQGPAIVLVGGLVLFLAWVQKFTGAVQVIKKGDRIKKAQTGFISIIFGLVACVGAIYVLAQLSNKQLFNGVTATISILGILFGGLYILIGQISKIQAGVKTSGTFIGLSILTAVITALFAVVTIAMHFGAAEAWQAVSVIAVLFTFLSGVLASAHKMTDTGKSLLGLMGVVIALGAVVAAFWVMAKVDFKALVSSVAMLSALMIAAAFAIKIIAKISMSDLVDAKQTIGFMAGILAVLVGAVWALSYFVENTDGILKSAGAVAILGVVFTGIFAVLSIFGKAKTGAIEAAAYGSVGLIVAIIGLITAMSIIMYTIQQLSDGFTNIEGVKKTLSEGIEIAYMMGAVISALVAGLFVGGARLVANELSEVAKRLQPFIKIVSSFPNDFAAKTAEFGKAMLALSWYGFWTSFVGGIGEKSSLKRLAENLKESAGPIRDASIAFMNVNIAGLNKAIDALISLSNLASSMSFFGAIFMRFKLGMLSGAIKAFTSSLDPITQDHVTKAGYVVDIFTKFAEMPTRERNNILSDQKSLLSMSMSLWTSTIFLTGIVKRLGKLDTSDLYNAQTNTEKLVGLFTTISKFTATLDKNMGLAQIISGSRETTLFEYYVFLMELGSLFGGKQVFKNLSTIAAEDINSAVDNVNGLIKVFEAVREFAIELEKSGGLLQAFEGTTTKTMNAYTKLINQLPGVADAVVLYGKKLMDPGNVNSVTAAINVTNSIAESFHNLADQNLTERLQAVAMAIRELGNSGIEYIPTFFSDEQTAIAINQAITNLVEQFRQALLAEYMKGTISGYLVAVINGALDALKKFDQAFYDRGVAINDALIRGIKSKIFDDKQVGKDMGNALIAGLESKDSLDINSPSKKMYVDGEMAAEGFRLGILSKFDQAKAAGEALGNAGGLGIGIGLAKSMNGAMMNPVFKKRGGFLDGVIGLLGGKIVDKETGEEASVEEAVQKTFDPLAELKNLPSEMEKVLDQMGLSDTFSSFQKTVDDLKGIFSPKGVQASAESMEKGLEATKDILSQLNGVPSDYENILEKTFHDTSYATDNFLSGLFGGVSPTEYIQQATEELENIYTGAMTDLTSGFTDWNMTDYLDQLTSGLDTSAYEYPITPVFTDENGNEITDWQSMLGGSGSGGTLSRTVAGYTAEDVRNLTLEIYHLEDALYSLKEAMKDQQVTHSGELTIRYSNETDFVDRIQTAIIGEIRREIRG